MESEDLIRGNASTWSLLKELARSKGHRTRLILGLVLLVSAVRYRYPVVILIGEPSSSKRFRVFRLSIIIRLGQ